MVFRTATTNDVKAIATLHADSWKIAYRGILSDEYLDGGVVENRVEVWSARFQNPKETQHIIVAEEEGRLKGFACIFANEDARWGALIDNLHVAPHLKGRGIGKKLIIKAADWVRTHYPGSALHLWVYEKNVAARAFYDKMSGKNVERQLHDNPDGSSAYALRYVWEDLDSELLA
jgi:GNAT superfamily N-acetyltransferase